VGHQAFCYRQIASDLGDDLFALAQVFGVGNRAGGAQLSSCCRRSATDGCEPPTSPGVPGANVNSTGDPSLRVARRLGLPEGSPPVGAVGR
jgi:hypothetical protein